MNQLAERLAAQQPVIVLLGDRGRRYHYVVVTSVEDRRVVVHDPSWGPSRAIDRAKFVGLWERSRFWSLVILPTPEIEAARMVSDQNRADTPAPAAEISPDSDRCAALLDRTVAEVRRHTEENDGQRLEMAERLLQDVRAQCPLSAGPLRELAGVKFAQKRWADAVELAGQALERDPADAYALDLLGSSLFLEDDVAGALRAWNRIAKPTLDLVRIHGIHRSRYQAIAATLGLRPNTLLTPEALARARRRLGELPDRTMARLDVRPDADGFAAVDVVVAERTALPLTWPAMAGVLVRAGVDREASVSLPGFAGEGEIWSADWRWWRNRPRAALSFTAPRPAGLFGTWRVDASWEEQSYSGSPFTTAPFVRESRAHGGLTVSDWLTGHLRYGLSVGLDAWKGGRRTPFVGASIERRSPADRVSLSADATTWRATANGPRFGVAGARAIARSSPDPQGWRLEAALGADYAADFAPLALWAGAGEGRAREPLLRAHPLLDDGVLRVEQHTVFGRTVAYSNVELQRWLRGSQSPVIGLAAFVDAARASRRLAPGDRAQADVGFGLRVRVPGINRILRIDAAHGLSDGANAITAGWMF